MHDFIGIADSVKQGLSSAYIVNVSSIEHGLSEVMKFARNINCDGGGCGYCNSCSKIDRGEHSDVFVIPEDEEFEGYGNIKIDEIRRIQPEAEMNPFEGKHRVFIVKYADRLTEQAQNSLLKMLEEAPAKSVLILLTSNVFGLLSTIRSRCRTFNYPYTDSSNYNFKEKLDELFTVSSAGADAFFDYSKTISKDKESLIDFMDFVSIILRDVLAFKSQQPLLSNGIDDKIANLNLSNVVDKIEKLSMFTGFVRDRNVNRELVAINSLALLFDKI